MTQETIAKLKELGCELKGTYKFTDKIDKPDNWSYSFTSDGTGGGSMSIYDGTTAIEYVFKLEHLQDLLQAISVYAASRHQETKINK